MVLKYNMILYRFVRQNIFSQVAYFTALFPYIVLFTLLVKGLTLPGAYEGISFFFTPKWNELLTIKVWYSALNQLFFSLGIATGSLINYSSHNEFSQDLYRDGIFLSFADTFTSVLAGATIFSILGNLASLKNVPVEEVSFVFRAYITQSNIFTK